VDDQLTAAQSAAVSGDLPEVRAALEKARKESRRLT